MVSIVLNKKKCNFAPQFYLYIMSNLLKTNYFTHGEQYRKRKECNGR